MLFNSRAQDMMKGVGLTTHCVART